jgi:hypothetical protein
VVLAWRPCCAPGWIRRSRRPACQSAGGPASVHQAGAGTGDFVRGKALDMSHQNVKQIALALERKGFLEIAVDAHDRRGRRLHLTEHHHRFWRQRNPMDFVECSLTAGLSDKEVATTVKLLKQLTAAARRQVARPGAQRDQPALVGSSTPVTLRDSSQAKAAFSLLRSPCDRRPPKIVAAAIAGAPYSHFMSEPT